MRGLATVLGDAAKAVSLLTIVPVSAGEWREPRPGVAAWFAFVGLALGATAWAFLYVLAIAGLGARAGLVSAALVVSGWAMLTRFLHWDGLADVADGLWGGATQERRLEIMRDSAIGAFGATAIALVVLVQVGAVASVAMSHRLEILLVVPALGRLAATCGAWLGTPARPDGLARLIIGRPGPGPMVVSAGAVSVCAAVLYVSLGLWGVAFSFLGVLCALVVPHLLSSKIGGVTGDIMGASVLVCETILLVVAAFAWGA